MLTVRFIRGGKGFHWHTERSMQLHDKNCNVVLDWTPEQEQYFGIVDTADMFIVNKWNRRTENTLKLRDHYAEYEFKKLMEDLDCQYQEKKALESYTN